MLSDEDRYHTNHDKQNNAGGKIMAASKLT
jgi:hypothetical protein